MFPNVTAPVNLTVSRPHARLSDEAISAMARLLLGLASRPQPAPTSSPKLLMTQDLSQVRRGS
jgi:hypothetical protein